MDQLLRTLPPAAHEGPAYVGLSGGRDSLALLHLLRFFIQPQQQVGRLHAIHVDHGMHPQSRGQARWVAGLCRAWQVPLTVRTLCAPPRGEGAAREARYACFRTVMDEEPGRGLLVLGHHAEDQAETVLFRLLRGTGPRGLAGIPAVRALGPGSPHVVLRPLLGLSGDAIAEWARRHHLRPREDPTNRDPGFRRNWIRHMLLPALGPEVRQTLLALAVAAEAREAVIARLLAPAKQAVVLGSLASDGVTVDRRRLNVYPLPVRAELLRALLRAMGARISRRGMEMALAFLASPVGRGELTAAPGLVLVREGRTGSIILRAGQGGDEGSDPGVETSGPARCL